MHAFSPHAEHDLRSFKKRDRRPDRRDPDPTRHFARCDLAHRSDVMPELKKTPGKCSQSQHGCSERSGWRPVSVRYSGMLNHTKPLLFGLTLLFSGLTSAQISNSGVLQYTKDGQMKFPEDYRQWVYLTTGFDMSYNPAMQMDHHMFDNVFVNPEAYKAFMATGKWPDKTTFVLEARRAMDKGSINQRGNYQGSDVMGL